MSSLVAITGANRGFGRALAVAAAKRWPDVTLLLSHRATSAGMDETEKMVKEANAGAKVVRWELDCSAPAVDIEKNAEANLGAALKGGAFAQVVMVHNAGSLGTMKKGEDVYAAEVQEAVHANVVACSVVHNAFLRLAGGLKETKVSVINVSSLLAVQAFTGFELYCIGKAARDMMIRVSKEEYPGIKFLNYAPGPMDTDMAKEIREDHHDAGVRGNFQELKDKNTVVCPFESARICLWLISEKEFESGTHHDYYDVKDEALSAMSKL